MLLRLQNFIVERLEAFRRQSPEEREQLACEIVEYGRMNTAVRGLILIEVAEAAYRLRELPRRIRRSLRLLEMKGIAHETDVEDVWRLSA